MKKRKMWKIFRRAGEDFTIGTGVISLIFSILTIFVGIPLAIVIPVVGGMGFIFALIGAYFLIKGLENQKKSIADDEGKLLIIIDEIKSDLHEIKKDLVKHTKKNKKKMKADIDFYYSDQMKTKVHGINQKFGHLCNHLNNGSTSSIFHAISHSADEIKNNVNESPTNDEKIELEERKNTVLKKHQSI